MAQNIFRLVLTDEAQNFIDSLPEAVSYKIFYNIKRVAGGERNKELFKKLENSEIWEFWAQPTESVAEGYPNTFVAW